MEMKYYQEYNASVFDLSIVWISIWQLHFHSGLLKKSAFRAALLYNNMKHTVLLGPMFR